MVKRIFGRLKNLLRQNSLAEVFFERDGLLCEQCGHVNALADLEPLSFSPCEKCGFHSFVPRMVSDYLIFEPAGAGGIASVYRAYTREHPERLFAVKILKQEHAGNREIVEAFLEECRIHSQVAGHPNVVQYVDGGFVDDVYFYAMDFVEGERLYRLVEQQGKLAEEEALAVLAQIVAGLKHIHGCGFLYRDLNADNVIVKPDGTAVIIDFGLALPLDEAAQASTRDHIWGTGEFLPPERIYREGEDAVSVIYSLGMLAYFLVTAEMMTKSSSVEGQVKRHISSTRLALTPDRFPGCSDATMELIVSMIQPDRAARYQSFEEVEEAIWVVLNSFDEA